MDKREALVNYYMNNILSEPEFIRDAIEFYLDSSPNYEVDDLYKDLLEE